MESLTRRDVLKGVMAATATMAAGSVLAAGEHMNHQGHQKTPEVVRTALHCIRDGEACLDHCIDLFKSGDTSVADCADTVVEMLAMCNALMKMASAKSKHLSAVAKVCAAVCKDCKKECEKHADKHAACKACAKSCEECIKACEKIAA